eukprot:6885403-Karenia_brevis.AAC.1
MAALQLIPPSALPAAESPSSTGDAWPVASMVKKRFCQVLRIVISVLQPASRSTGVAWPAVTSVRVP